MRAAIVSAPGAVVSGATAIPIASAPAIAPALPSAVAALGGGSGVELRLGVDRLAGENLPGRYFRADLRFGEVGLEGVLDAAVVHDGPPSPPAATVLGGAIPLRGAGAEFLGAGLLGHGGVSALSLMGVLISRGERVVGREGKFRVARAAGRWVQFGRRVGPLGSPLGAIHQARARLVVGWLRSRVAGFLGG